jgi:predicted phosphodiesterase
MQRPALITCALLCAAAAACADTLYVATNSASDGPGTAWSNAFHEIQDAVDAAASNDTVLVTNGVYDTGGVVLHGQGFTNRVVINKNITVTSVNGATNTSILGASDGGNGPAAARCVYISDGLLTGFSIANGHTQTTGDWGNYQRGGGVYLDGGGIVSNCVISGCSAAITGGGVDFDYGGTVVDCVIEDNAASHNSDHGGGGVHLHDGALLDRCVVRNNSAPGHGADGGGLYFWSGGHARNCLIEGNAARNGGGGIYVKADAADALIENCTVAGNSGEYGGGMYLHGGTNRNCIIYDNTTTGAASTNWVVGSGSPAFEYCCTAPTNGLSAYGGAGCIDDAPRFVDVAAGNYRLRSYSPCVDAGANALVTCDQDRAGKPRLADGDRDGATTVDIGAYERAASDGGSFLFALLGDTQPPKLCSAGLSERVRHYNKFEAAVPHVNAVGPDFTIFPGDLSEGSDDWVYERFMEIANRINGPRYYVYGNHDGSTDAFTTHTGSPVQYAMDLYGYHFVVLNSRNELPEGYAPTTPCDGKWYGGYVESNGMAFLEQDLAAVPEGKPVIMVGHYPFFNVPCWDVANWDDVKETVGASDVRLLLSGHKHRFQVHRDEGMPNIVNGSCSFSLGPSYPPENGFSLVAVNGSGIMVAWVPVEPLMGRSPLVLEASLTEEFSLAAGSTNVSLSYAGPDELDAVLRVRYRQETVDPQATFTKPTITIETDWGDGHAGRVAGH